MEIKLPSFKSALAYALLTTLSLFARSNAQDDERNRCNGLDGKVHSLGEKYQVASFWYQCITGVNGYAYSKLSGCVSIEGKLMDNGETYVRNKFVYECTVVPGGLVKHRIVGCINDNNEQVQIGATWLNPSTSVLQFRKACVSSSNGVQVTVQSCRYSSGSRFSIEIKVGCYMAVDDGQFFTCSKGTKRNSPVSSGFTSKTDDLVNLSGDKDCELLM